MLDRREGFRVYYRLAEACQRGSRLLFDFLRQACQADESLQDDVRRLKRAIRHGACTQSEFHPYSALRAGKAATHADR